jgi:hypothetical protein
LASCEYQFVSAFNPVIIIDFSPPKTLIAGHEFIIDKSVTATIAPGGGNKRENSIARKETGSDFRFSNQTYRSCSFEKETEDECGRQSEDFCRSQSEVGKDQGEEVVSEAGEESQKQDERRSPSQDFSRHESALGQEKGKEVTGIYPVSSDSEK